MEEANPLKRSRDDIDDSSHKEKMEIDFHPASQLEESEERKPLDTLSENEDMHDEDGDEDDDDDDDEEADEFETCSLGDFDDDCDESNSSGAEVADDGEGGYEDNGDEWDLGECRYDAHDHGLEPNPDCAAYRPAYREINQRLAEYLSDFPDLSAHLGLDERIERLHEYFTAAQVITPPEAARIAFLGEAGKGKSTTLNSFLDKIRLAETGASGSSCTNVVIEYRSPLSWQETQYAVEIDWHNETELKETLKELVEKYQQFRFKRKNQERWSKEEHQGYRDEARNVVQILNELFCNEREFGTQRATHEYLSTSADYYLEHVVNRLVKFAMKNIPQIADEPFRSCFEASSTLELRQKLSPYTKSQKGKPSLWHLVKLVRIGIKHIRVLEALSVVDMPGRSDRNFFRVKKTNAELSHCNGCWLICNCDRVRDNHMISKYVEEAFDRFDATRTGSIALICTHAEMNVNESLLKSLKRDRAAELNETKIALWKKTMTQLQKQKAELNRKISASDSADKANLYEERDAIISKLTHVQREEFNHIVNARASHIERTAQSAFAQYVPTHKALPVYCIANLAYEKIKFESSNELLELEAATTRIPQLRTLAMKLAARRIEQAREVNLDKVIKLQATIQLFIGNIGMEEKEHIIHRAQQARFNIKPLIDKQMNTRQDVLTSSVLEKLKDENQLKKFRKAARERLAAYSPAFGRNISKSHAGKLHPHTFGAFCKYNGVWKTKHRGQVCWNDEFLMAFKEEFDKAFIVFEATNFDSISLMEAEIYQLFDSIPNMLDEVMHPSTKTMKDFVESRKRAVGWVFVAERDRQSKFFQRVRVLATKDGYESYFGQTMNGTYKECRNVAKPGVTRKKYDILQDRLKGANGNSPFLVVLQTVEDAFKKDQTVYANKLAKEIRSIFQTTTRDMKKSLDTTLKALNKGETAKVCSELQIWHDQTKPKLEALRKSLEESQVECAPRSKKPNDSETTLVCKDASRSRFPKQET